MGPLFIRCPATNIAVSTGIETNRETLASTWRSTVRVACSHCGDVHDIEVHEFFITDPPGGKSPPVP